VQTLFAEKKNVDYFVVKISDHENNAGLQMIRQGLTPNEQNSPIDQRTTLDTMISTDAARLLQSGFEQAQKENMERYTSVEKIGHVSELTAFLRESGFHAHLEGVDLADIPAVYQIPDAAEQPELSAICSSVARVLRKAMDVLDYDKLEERQLSKLNARLLNTFRRSETSQDPIKPLQNSKSKQTYIRTFQRLFCYFSRVTSQQYLQKKPMFNPTASQLTAWTAVTDAASASLQSVEANARSEEDEEERVARLHGKLDSLVLAFGLELVRHRLHHRAFDSAIVSFLAITAWDWQHNTWMVVGDYTSYMSQITYDVQLLLLQHCITATEEDDSADFTKLLTEIRDEWLLNDTHGPMSEILSLRLHAGRIAKTTVQTAQIRWKSDNETIIYKDIELPMQSIRDLVQHQLALVKSIFKQDLCFDLEDIPRYPLDEIVDNWDARSPGASFLTDVRNAHLKDGMVWLFKKMTNHPELAELFLSRGSGGDWYLRSSAVKQYERAVQRFLEHLSVLVHVGSGQPARRVEFLGLRWCNKQADMRNIFIHDGNVIFMLSYHKSLNLTNAARFPVRVLLPEVGELLVQYLVLIMQLRVWMLHQIKSETPISEYLWAGEEGIWSEDRMTRVFTSATTTAVGIKIDVRSWRQIIAGVVIKKFAGMNYQLDAVNEDGDEDQPGMLGGAMPEALHWQASHTPTTGNQAYGGTVNFRGGMTDAALQEFIRVSHMWHTYIHGDEVKLQSIKHQRAKSGDMLLQPPLAKRLTWRGPKQQCRRVWNMEEARQALQQIHGPLASYKTLKQEETIQAVVRGLSPIISILGTGEGKSLAYMLQQRLMGAGTTVVIVPMLALKKDTIRKCQDFGIECRVWNEEPAYGIGNALILVSLDEAVGITFRGFLHRLHSEGQLGSIVLDECHLVVTASRYREKMEMTKDFRKLGCQMIYLTATLPIHMSMQFSERLLLSEPVTIRSLTVRKDIDYQVTRIPGPDMFSTACEYIGQAMNMDWFQEEIKARAIVYCQARADVVEAGKLLNGLCYYSDSGTKEEKDEAMEAWMRGDVRVIVATSAFAEGVDYPQVRLVFHINPRNSAIEFVQGVGRGGRDGQGAISCVFLSTGWRPKIRTSSGELMCPDVAAMQRYLDSPRCRLLVLRTYLDGVAQFCEDKNTACDRCILLGLVRGEARESEEKEYRRTGGTVLEIGEDLDKGAQLVMEQQMEGEARKVVFMQNLDLVRGLCVVCLIHGDAQGKSHSLDSCRSNRKQAFFRAKAKALKDKDGRRKAWLATYSGCYRCGLSQTMCEQQGGSGCIYRDIVMPLSWSAFEIAKWRKHVEKVAKRRFEKENDYMEWLGCGVTVFNETGSNLLVVSEDMLKEIVLSLKGQTKSGPEIGDSRGGYI